jgi:hypothetical protein
MHARRRGASECPELYNAAEVNLSRERATVQKYMITLFNLKKGVDPAEYEKWAREVDVPVVRSLESVKSMRLNRVVGTLDGSDPPYQYMELIEITDFDKLGQEAQSEAIGKVAAEFQSRFAADLVFLFEEQVI